MRVSVSSSVVSLSKKAFVSATVSVLAIIGCIANSNIIDWFIAQSDIERLCFMGFGVMLSYWLVLGFSIFYRLNKKQGECLSVKKQNDIQLAIVGYVLIALGLSGYLFAAAPGDINEYSFFLLACSMPMINCVLFNKIIREVGCAE